MRQVTSKNDERVPMDAIATEWDPTRPVLGRLLVRREELGAAMVRLFADDRACFDVWDTSRVPHLGGMPGMKQVTEPFPVADLLAEQVPASEQMLAALTGSTLEFKVTVHTCVQPLLPCVIPDEGYDVSLRIQYTGDGLSLVYIHMPLSYPE